MNKINVLAFGGLGGRLYSTGLKTILMRLDGVPGVDFKTFEDYTSWGHWGDTLASWRDPTVILGHSYGVAAAFGAVRRMGNRGPKIPLAIMFDASQWAWMSLGLWGSGGNTVPDRVESCINFYQHGFPIGSQRLARADGGTRGINNSLVENISHGAIEDHPTLQNKSVETIKLVISAINKAA